MAGHGVPAFGPTITGQDTVESEEPSEDESENDTLEQARQILEDAGWRTNNLGLLEKQIDGSAETLHVTLRTSNAPLFVAVSALVKRQWEALGVEVSVDVIDAIFRSDIPFSNLNCFCSGCCNLIIWQAMFFCKLDKCPYGVHAIV